MCQLCREIEYQQQFQDAYDKHRKYPWPQNFPPETAMDKAILADKTNGKYPVPGYGWTLSERQAWRTQEDIDRLDPKPQRSWVPKPWVILSWTTLIVLGLGSWYLVYLIVMSSQPVNTAIRG